MSGNNMIHTKIAQQSSIVLKWRIKRFNKGLYEWCENHKYSEPTL